MIQELFQRVANGSSVLDECRRLSALGVLPGRRHAKKGEVVAAVKWYPGRLARILHSTVYRGEHTVKSKYGTITREVPALVSQEVWQQAQQTIDHNRKLPKNQKYREYLLRRLIQCGLCGRNFIGQPINRKQKRVDFYYRWLVDQGPFTRKLRTAVATAMSKRNG